MKTAREIKEELIRLDEISVMELLELTSEDLVNAFEDKIDDKLEQLQKELEE